MKNMLNVQCSRNIRKYSTNQFSNMSSPYHGGFRSTRFFAFRWCRENLQSGNLFLNMQRTRIPLSAAIFGWNSPAKFRCKQLGAVSDISAETMKKFRKLGQGCQTDLQGHMNSQKKVIRLNRCAKIAKIEFSNPHRGYPQKK